MAKKGFLRRLKSSGVAQNIEKFAPAADTDGVDLNKGVVKLDQPVVGPKVTTNDVFHSEITEFEESLVDGTPGKVFMLDLRPFFYAIKARPDTRLGKSLIVFSDNLLSRRIGKRGSHTLHKDRAFFFRLKLMEAESFAEAARIVNDLGSHFLRDAFKAEKFIPQVLGVVEARDLLDGADRFDGSRAIDSRAPVAKGQVRMTAKGPVWRPIVQQDNEAEPALSGWAPIVNPRRGEATAVRRGPERRWRSLPIAGPDRRKRDNGRREADDPRRIVW